MANNQNTSSTILSEHRKIVGTRYVLATLNFLAVLLGMIVTLFFVSRRGIYDAVLTVIWALIIINIVQIVLCVGEYILRVGFGINVKALPAISYIVGGLWLAALALELVLATVEAGTLRTDLLIVAIIQAVVALVAYILWPNLDRRAIDSMIKPSSRGDEKKRARKAKRYVATYGILTVLIVLAQAATLLLYKMPPTFYDLFADNRALAYELNDDKDGYIVSNVYNGTSPYVNIPATYNNLPVVGIKAGALVDDGIIEKYKITSITFGTPEKDENGNEVMKSNLQFINSGAIVCSRVETISIPESVTALEDGAIRGAALRTVEYSARANFKYSAFSGCTSLARILMSGERVGVIASLEGMPDRVNIQVDKDIYNNYRESNLNYVSSFSPILADDEFCIDFFTGCDYYIDSIFAKKGETVKLSYASLKKDGAEGTPLSVDTLAYIGNAHELGTDGAKADAAFRGWYYDASYVEKVDFTEFGEVSFTESTKIYAKWINEYNATLNWGTYKPAGQVDKVYWTDEDIRSFPVVTDRNGYSKGVVWTNAGTGDKLTNSDGISESIALTAAWQFDAPNISLDYVLNGGSETITVGGATFVYDETKTLQLSALKSHALEKDQINNTVDYDYEWYKDGKKIDAFANTDVVRLQNVLESGVYTLRVTATPHYYADAGTYAEINYNVQITKKALNLGDVTFNYLAAEKQFTYNGGMQSCVIEGNVATPGVGVTYTYANDNGYTSGNGMINAGAYDVTATFAKVDPAEADNYATATLTTRATVKPIVLSTPTWSNNSFVYDKAEHGVYISFAEAIAGEDVGVVYEGASATDAGNYIAIVKDITNTNYTRVGVDANLLSCSWTISPKVITVKNWTLNGSSASTVTYTGSAHKVSADTDGVIHGDVINFKYDEDGSTMSATNVGKYIAKVTGVTNSNYTLDTSATFAWEIKPAKLTVTFNNSGKLTYNGKAQSIYATVSGIVEADVDAFAAKDFDTEGTTATVSLAAGDNANSVKILFSATNVGKDDYVAKINGLLSGGQHLANYEIEAAEAKTKTFNITPKTIQIRRGDEIYTYNGKEQNMLLHVDGVLTQDRENITFTIGEGGEKVPNTELGVFIFYKGVNAGDYPTSITAVNDTNYQLDKAYNTPITISKKVVTISNWTMTDGSTNKTVAWDDGAFTYNKMPYTVGYTLQGAVAGENVTLHLENASYTEVQNANYRTVATLADDTNADNVNKNYAFETASTEWKINPAPITITWKVDNGTQTTFEYSKENHVVSYAIEGMFAGDDISLNLKSGENITSTTSAGTHKITVVSLSNPNYVIDDGASFTWSITPKEITIEWRLDGLDKASTTYSAQNHSVTPVFVGLIGDDTTSIYYDDVKNQTVGKNAGNYSIVATKIGNTNYTIKGGSSSFEWKINQLPVVIEWTGGTAFTYNGVDQAPKANIQNKLGSDSFSISYSGEGKNAGNYTVKVTDLGNKNYTLTDADGVEQQYTINKLPLVISWTTDKVFTYNAKNQYPTAIVDNRIFGDEITITYEGIASNAGDHRVSIKDIDNNNYTLTDATGDMSCGYTINQCPVAIVWSYDNIIYNAKVQHPTARVVSDTFGRTVEINSYTGDILVAKNVGTYTVVANGLSDENFTFGTINVSHSYEIDKRTLSYEWYGMKNGETIENLNKLVYDGMSVELYVKFGNVCSGDETMIYPVYNDNTRINAGSIVPVVTIAGDLADNYTFTSGASLSKTFTIEKQPVVITWTGESSVYYNKAGQKIGYTVVGKLDGLTVVPTLTVNNVSADKNDTYTNAGTYTYKLSIANDSNYTLVNCTGDSSKNLVINPARVTVNWSKNEFTYDGTLKTVSIGSVVNDSLSISNIQLLQNTMTAAGSQTVTATSKDSNYEITNPKIELVIKPREVRITGWSKNTFTYDGKAHSLTAYVSIVTLAGEGEVNLTPALSYKNNSITNFGSTNVEVYLSSTNYKFVDGTNVNKTLTINQREVKITGWNQYEFVYDGKAHSTSVNIEIVTLDGEGNLSLNPKLSYINNSITNVSDYAKARVQLDSNNYKFVDGTVIEKELKVTPCVVTITGWSQNSYIYDGSQKSITAYVQVNNAPTPKLNYKNNTLTNVKRDNNGNVIGVTAEVTLASSNYVFAEGAQTTQTFKITPKAVGIMAWTADKLTYNGQAQSIKVTVNDTNAQNTLTYENNTLTNVGTTTAKVYVGSNYEFVSGEVTTHTFTVEPRVLGISWTLPNASYEFVERGYNFSATPTNVVGSDVVSFSFEGGTNKTNVGDYTIKISGISGKDSGNYVLPAACQKVYTITPQRVSIRWPQTTYTYDGEGHVPTVEVVGVLDRSTTVPYTAFKANKDAGSYVYSVVLTNDNYTIAGCEGNYSTTMTITPAKVTVSWSSTSVVYDGQEHSIRPTVTGVYGKIDDSKITVSGNRGKDVGSYSFTIISIADPNYTLNGVANTTGTLKITARPVTIIWKNLNQTYGMMDDKTEFVDLQNVVAGDDVALSINDFYTTSSVGSYTLTANTLVGSKKNNYTISSDARTTNTLVVGKQTVQATWTDTVVTYDGNAHAPTLVIKDVHGNALLTNSVTTKTNYGSYTYRASDYFTDTKNYELLENTACMFIIEKKEVDINNITVTYDKVGKRFVVAFNDVLEKDKSLVSASFSVMKDDMPASNSYITESGVYTISFAQSSVYISSSNYSLTGESAVSIEVVLDASGNLSIV